MLTVELIVKWTHLHMTVRYEWLRQNNYNTNQCRSGYNHLIESYNYI